MSSSPFWVITQRRWYLVIDVSEQSIGSISNIKIEPWIYPETSVNNNQLKLRNIPETPRPHLHRRGSLKSRKQ